MCNVLHIEHINEISNYPKLVQFLYLFSAIYVLYALLFTTIYILGI
jgi:hypothetical protein